MTSSTIPPGSGELVKIVPNGPSDILPFGISNLIFSDAPGNSLDFHYDDGGSLPGDVIFSEISILLNGSSYDGWNYVDLIEHGIILSGKYWVGFKMYSSSRSIGQDLSSEFSENHILSIYKAGADAWQPVGGNLGFNILTEVVGQSICDCDGTVPGDGYCGCNGEVLDCGGVCGGVANVDVCGVCEGDGWSCVPYGDVNKDYNVNVIDLIMMVDYILFPENEDYFLDTNQFAVADVNVDGLINISDIVSIIEFMFDQLGRDINYIEEVTIHKTRKGLELINSGFVTFDINISHENNFNYELTDKALLAMSKNSEYSTRIIISNPEQNTLIETSNDFTVDDIIAVGKNGQYLDVSIILMPTEFVLLPAYPNPFNPSTTFKYGVPIEGPINIAIYNIRGREIVTLYDDLQQVGYHTMVWNASGYASGLYFLKLSSSEATTMKKIMLIK